MCSLLNLGLLQNKGMYLSAVFYFQFFCAAVVNSVSGADTTETSSRANNPMVRLFCGQFLSAGINEGMMLLPWLFAVNICAFSSLLITFYFHILGP